jgi:thiopurine S-methyltransferase
MDAKFWRERWDEGRIGFHEGKPNALLQRHVAALGAGRRVLVPLCGKSDDLAYLAAAGHAVVGVELVEDAARAFFAEHGLAPEASRAGDLTRLRAGAVEILAGDLFAARRDDVGAVDALYDRAALIAFPPEMRPRYVAHLRTLLAAPAVRGLLVSLEYPHGALEGPPFSVDDAEVRRHWPEATLLEAIDTASERLRAAGVSATERAYALTL